MISILLATYNGQSFIQQSINSILNQTFKEFELLIGFNGTTDNSKNIVAEYDDSRIKIFDYGDDKGKAKTLNKLIKEAKFDWIAIQDDDDIWLPNKLENQVKFLEYFDIIGTQINYIDKNSNIIGGVYLEINDRNIKQKSLSGNNQIANSSSIVRKRAVEEINGWDENLFGVEDYDLWLKLIRKDYRFKNLDETFVLHRIHQNSNFNNTEKQHDHLSKLFL